MCEFLLTMNKSNDTLIASGRITQIHGNYCIVQSRDYALSMCNRYIRLQMIEISPEFDKPALEYTCIPHQSIVMRSSDMIHHKTGYGRYAPLSMAIMLSFSGCLNTHALFGRSTTGHV